MNCSLERERKKENPWKGWMGNSLGPGFSAGPCWRRWAGLGGSPQHLGTSAGTSECGPAPLFPLIVRALKSTSSICSTCWEAQGTQLALEHPNCPSALQTPTAPLQSFPRDDAGEWAESRSTYPSFVPTFSSPLPSHLSRLDFQIPLGQNLAKRNIQKPSGDWGRKVLLSNG